MLKKYFKSGYLIDTATLVSGVTIAQLLPLILSPVLSRLFSPNDFSVLGLFLSISTIGSLIVTFRFDMAIILPKFDSLAIELIKLSIAVSFLISGISFLFFFPFNNQIANFLNNKEISIWLPIIPLAIIFLSINNIFNYWFTRMTNYKLLSFNRIFKSISISVISVFFGVLKFISGGLIIGQVIGNAISAIWLWKRFFLPNKSKIFIWSWKKIRYSAYKYRDFPLFNLPTSILNTVSNELPIFLFSIYFSSEITGKYFFVIRILSLPITFIGSAVSQTFYPKFNSLVNSQLNRAKKFLVSLWGGLFGIMIIPSIIILIWGESVFGFIFGPEWAESGKIASILILFILFKFISSPTSTAFAVLNIQKISLFFGFAVLIYRSLSLMLGIHFNNFYLGLKIMVACEVIQIIIYNILIIKKLNQLKNDSNR